MVEADGAQLTHRVDGAGPDLLLVHAGIADMRMWDPLVALLSDRFRCIRFDMRGFGTTRYGPEPFTPADDVEAVLAGVGATDAVVVGASFGGLVALDHASRHPERVKRLILLDPPLPDHNWSEAMIEFFEAEEEAFEEGRVDDAVELNVRLWVGGATEDQQALVREMQRNAFELQLATEPVAGDPEPRLDAVRAPTVIGYGERDVADFVAIAQRLAHELPDAELHEIPDAGHLPALENPTAVAALISA